jgi:menaquinone-dependent protoporphyrinogen IX oxidase
MTIIIYGSKYGATKQYAHELSKKTGIKAEKYTDIQDINQYGTIIYLGALYAGSVLGMKKTLNKIEDCHNKKIIIATVGLADPTDKGNIERIREGIKRQLSNCIYNQANIYFLRGGIDYSLLNLKHKTMMAFAYKKSKRLKEEERTAEIKAIIETYGKKVDFIDFDKLNPIVDEIK